MGVPINIPNVKKIEENFTGSLPNSGSIPYYRCLLCNQMLNNNIKNEKHSCQKKKFSDMFVIKIRSSI